jgi:uncharacterized membrane protein
VSQRIYSGPRTDRQRPGSGWLGLLPWGLAAATILGQIIWVLAEGNRPGLSILTVVTFFLASASHAVLNRGWTWALGFLAISLAFGWGIERLGLVTSFPFGTYEYADALGPKLGGVPLVIPLAWSMMAYPILLAAQRLTSTGVGTALIGGWGLAAWDLFLDPQMVGEGYWIWSDVGWSLPGMTGIPLQNNLGWLLSSIALMALLNLLPRRAANDGVPILMLSWVYFSSVFANLVFFDRPGVAMWGGVAMGIVVIPYLWRSWSEPL